MINRPPEVVRLTVDLLVHLVEMPTPAAHLTQPIRSLSADFGSEQWTEPVPPVAYRLVADLDATLMEEVLDVPKGQREPHVEHHCQADDAPPACEVVEALTLPMQGKSLCPLSRFALAVSKRWLLVAKAGDTFVSAPRNIKEAQLARVRFTKGHSTRQAGTIPMDFPHWSTQSTETVVPTTASAASIEAKPIPRLR